MKIAMGNDHTAISMKEAVKAHLETRGIEVSDLGTNSTESCDYPVYGEKVGRAVAAGEADLGIVICGTGVGISLAANKVKGIRACVAANHILRNYPECTTTPMCWHLVQGSSAKKWQK